MTLLKQIAMKMMMSGASALIAGLSNIMQTMGENCLLGSMSAGRECLIQIR